MLRTVVAAVTFWLATALAVSPAMAAGKIVVSSDEWPLSDWGFQAGPDATRFALNLASFFTGGQPGRFLVYSTNQGLTGSHLASTMVGAGHTWTIKNPATAPAEDFSRYDAVFVGQNTVDTQRLTDYVHAGGNVYVVSGTGFGSADTSWNAFLSAFGLTIASRSNGLSGAIAIQSTHPLFAGVHSLFMVAGNSVSVDPTYSGGAVVASSGREGLFGVFTAITLPMAIRTASCHDDVELRRTGHGNGMLKVALYGTAAASSTSVDVGSVKLLDLRPATGRGNDPLADIGDGLVCLARLDGFAGLPLRFDAKRLANTIWQELGNTIDDGEVVLVTLSGRLKPEHGGTAIRAHDTIILRTR